MGQRKSKKALRRMRQGSFLMSAALGALAMASRTDSVQAANFYWDTNGATAGTSNPPTGSWDGATLNWSNGDSTGSIATTTYVANSDVFFSAGTNGTNAATITVVGAQVANSITFEEGQNTLTGGSLNVAGGNINFVSGVGNTTISSVISGSTSINKTQTNTLNLAGVNTYTGSTNVNAGTIVTGVSNAIPFTSGVSVAGTLSLGTTTQAFGAVNGAGTLSINNSTVNIGNDNASGTFSGTVSNNGLFLTKSGTGTQVWTSNFAVSAGNSTLTVINGTLTMSGTGRFSSGTASNVSPIALHTFGTITLDNSATNNGGTGRIQTSGNMRYFGGSLNVIGNTAAATTETLAGTEELYGGMSTITMTPDPAQSLSIDRNTNNYQDFTRNINSMMLVRGTNLGSTAAGGSAFKNIAGQTVGNSGTAPGVSRGVIPWMIGGTSPTDGGSTFVVSSRTNGSNLQVLTNSDFNADTFVAAQNTRLTTAQSLAADTTINSLLIQSGGSVADNGAKTLTVASGAVLFAEDGSIGQTSSTIIRGSTTGAELVMSAAAGKTGTVNATVMNTSGATKLTTGGKGTLVFTSNSNYTGNTTINSGVVQMNNGASSNVFPNSTGIAVRRGAKLDATTLSSSTLVLGSTQVLSGNGSVAGTVTIGGGANVSPGDAQVGFLQTGSQNWNSSGNYKWKVSGITGQGAQTPTDSYGAGGDWMTVGGNVTVNATSASSASKFTIDISGLNNSVLSTPGVVPGFDRHLNYQWYLARGTSAVSGFDATAFQFNTNNFTNNNQIASVLGTGVFSIVQGGGPEIGTANDVVLKYTGFNATNLYWKGSINQSYNGTSGLNTNWNTDQSSNINSQDIPGPLTNAFFSADTPTQSTVSVGGNFTLNSMTFNAPTGVANMNITSNTLTLLASGGMGLTQVNGAGIDTVTSNLVLGTSQKFDIQQTNTANYISFSGVFSEFAGSPSKLTKVGPGLMWVNASNTYTGGTDINAGTIIAMQTNSLATAGTINVAGAGVAAKLDVRANNWTHNMNLNDLATVSYPQINQINVIHTVANNATVNIVDTNTNTTPTTFNVPNAIAGGNASSVINWQAGSNTTPQILNMANNYAGTSVIQQGQLRLDNAGAHTGKITVNANGYLALGANATYAMPVDMNGGTLNVENNTVPNLSGTLTVVNSSQIQSQNVTTGVGNQNFQISGVVAGADATKSLTKIGGGNLTLSGSVANTFSGTWLVNAGTLVLNKTTASQTTAIAGSLTVNNGGTVAWGTTNADNQVADSSNVTVNTGGLLAIGARIETFDTSVGTLTLNGATGANVITSGSGNLTFAGGVNFMTHNGGVIDKTTSSGSYSLITNVQYQASSAAQAEFRSTGGNNLSLLNNLRVQQFDIADSGSLAAGTSEMLISAQLTGGGFTGATVLKTGTGQLEFSHTNNTYVGETFVNVGTLKLTASTTNNITGTPKITVQSGATLQTNSLGGGGIVLGAAQTLTGGGTVNGGVIIGGGAKISPGSSPGTMTTGFETWAGAGHYVWEIDNATGTQGSDIPTGGYDWLSATGAINITSTSASKFVVDITSLTHPGHIGGNANNWSQFGNFSWIIASSATAVNGTVDTSTISLNTSGFTNPTGGAGFSIKKVGNDVVLDYNGNDSLLTGNTPINNVRVMQNATNRPGVVVINNSSANVAGNYSLADGGGADVVILNPNSGTAPISGSDNNGRVGWNATATTGARTGKINIGNTSNPLDPINVSNGEITVNGAVVDNRVVASTIPAFGNFLKNSVANVAGVSNLSSGNNDDNNFTRIGVAVTPGGPDANGISLTSGTGTSFAGTVPTSTGNRSMSGVLNTSSSGAKTGSFSQTVTGEGLVGEVTNAVNVQYSANVAMAVADNFNTRNSYTGTNLTGLVSNGTSYSGLESKVDGYIGTAGAGSLNSVATIRAGKNTAGGDRTVNETWRTRNHNDATHEETGFGSVPPMTSVGQHLAADVIRLTGMETAGNRTIAAGNEFGRRYLTDAYTLQIGYNGASVGGGEAGNAAAGRVYLAWLDPDMQGNADGTADNATYDNADDRWVNAVDGNFVAGDALSNNLQVGLQTNFQGSWDSFVTAHATDVWGDGVGVSDVTLHHYLGSWGVDTSDWTDNDRGGGPGINYGGNVWAVLDHNSDFSVVPEPGTIGLLGLAAMGALGQRRRRRKNAESK